MICPVIVTIIGKLVANNVERIMDIIVWRGISTRLRKYNARYIYLTQVYTARNTLANQLQSLSSLLNIYKRPSVLLAPLPSSQNQLSRESRSEIYSTSYSRSIVSSSSSSLKYILSPQYIEIQLLQGKINRRPSYTSTTVYEPVIDQAKHFIKATIISGLDIGGCLLQPNIYQNTLLSELIGRIQRKLAANLSQVLGRRDTDIKKTPEQEEARIVYTSTPIDTRIILTRYSSTTVSATLGDI